MLVAAVLIEVHTFDLSSDAMVIFRAIRNKISIDFHVAFFFGCNM